MHKTIKFAVGLLVAVAYTFQLAYAGECTDGLFSRVQTNLEWTVNNKGAHDCAFGKILRREKDAYNAFADCNSAFHDGGLLNPLQNDYVDCRQRVCAWFIKQNLTPACL
jgi:hypothetical protein